MGTPYWDLSFASILKVYVENIMVADLTFKATNTGFVGLCEGKSLVYITTAGGFIGDKNFGYDYMCGVADMFGIPETELIKAEALDIEGFDAEKIMEKSHRRGKTEILKKDYCTKTGDWLKTAQSGENTLLCAVPFDFGKSNLL